MPLPDILGGPVGPEPMCVPGGGAGGGTGAGGSSGAGGMSGATGAGGMSGAGGGGGTGAVGFPLEFCTRFCGKCDSCWNAGGGFDDGDCLYMLSKPNFSLDDCMAGCAVGRTPGFPPANLRPDWESLTCLDWDASM